MKRLLALALMFCLVLSLAGCGGKSSPEAAEKDIKDELAELEDSGFLSEEDLDGLIDIQGVGENEFIVSTNLVQGGGSATFKTGEDLVWDPEKVGGLPAPEGVTVFMESDMSGIIGQDYAYSYSVTGLTREAYLEYIEMLKERFPKVFTEQLSEDSHNGSCAD